MTPPQPHPYRCETCGNENCDLSNTSLEKAEKTNTDVGRIRMMILLRRATEIHGCCSHSQHQNTEQRIADAIILLDTELSNTDGSDYHDTCIEVLSLLREGK